MARKTREEREREEEYLEQRAWSAYVSGLSRVDNAQDAFRFAHGGPSGTDPGSRLYHNLGCYLHGNPLDRPSKAEEAELAKLEQRAAAKGLVVRGVFR